MQVRLQDGPLRADSGLDAQDLRCEDAPHGSGRFAHRDDNSKRADQRRTPGSVRLTEASGKRLVPTTARWREQASSSRRSSASAKRARRSVATSSRTRLAPLAAQVDIAAGVVALPDVTVHSTDDMQLVRLLIEI